MHRSSINHRQGYQSREVASVAWTCRLCDPQVGVASGEVERDTAGQRVLDRAVAQPRRAVPDLYALEPRWDDQLDIYEVVFDKAVRSARITKLRKVNRRENATEDVEDTRTGEVRTVVEAALDRYKKTGLNAEEDFVYRLHLRRAIVALPTDKREVIDLLLTDIPIETSKDGEPSMTKLLGCVEKTVRNRRDRAYARIRRALDLEIGDGE